LKNPAVPRDSRFAQIMRVANTTTRQLLSKVPETMLAPGPVFIPARIQIRTPQISMQCSWESLSERHDQQPVNVLRVARSTAGQRLSKMLAALRTTGPARIRNRMPQITKHGSFKIPAARCDLWPVFFVFFELHQSNSLCRRLGYGNTGKEDQMTRAVSPCTIR
jgi:hypothetical protein